MKKKIKTLRSLRPFVLTLLGHFWSIVLSYQDRIQVGLAMQELLQGRGKLLVHSEVVKKESNK
mgnify:CR=1 FL=1